MSRILFSLFVSGIKWAIELKISCLYSSFPQRTFSKKQAKSATLMRLVYALHHYAAVILRVLRHPQMRLKPYPEPDTNELNTFN